MQQPSGELKIIAVEGEGAVNNVRSKSATQPAVEVRDQEDKPVAGAEVIFQLPAAGPGGVFNGWMRTQTARTNEQGQATASGFTPNEEEGRFNIKVTASSGNRSSSLVIGQSNGRNGGGSEMKSRSNLWKILAVVGAGALIGGIVAATRGGDSSSAVATPVSVTPGPITVGGPR
ncbi:MAG: hypothetical protein WD696_14510 [Bryobacteraceae bacterium]